VDAADRKACRFYSHIPPEDRGDYKIGELSAKNVIYCKDSRDMSELPDNSVHMIITSPPYNAGKEYEEDLPIDEYFALLGGVFRECMRVLIPGGRIAVNCPLLVGRVVPVPVSTYICQTLLDVGFRFRTIFVWDKGVSAGKSTAWGSWMSASNPYTFDTSELIYVFSKNCMARLEKGESTITRNDFLVCTTGTWQIPTESRRRHPAPFPVELPRRLIELYTFKSDVILDPFIGSGTTAVAAIRTGRYFVGYELKDEYVVLAKARVKREVGIRAYFF